MTREKKKKGPKPTGTPHHRTHRAITTPPTYPYPLLALLPCVSTLPSFPYSLTYYLYATDQNLQEKKAHCRLLSLQARNEYGVFDALVLYGLDIVVEPHKATVLSVTGVTIAPDGCGDIVAEEDRSGSGSEVQQLSTVSINDGGERRGSKRTQQVVEEEITRKKSFFRWVLTPLDEDGAPVPDAPPMLNVALDGGGAGFAGFAGGEGAGGAGVDGPTITLAEAGTVSLLKVTEFLEDGLVIGEGRATVSCRYVRRELRELTEKDREAFMDAMVQFYTAPTTVAAGEGLELHYQHFAEVHNADVRIPVYSRRI